MEKESNIEGDSPIESPKRFEQLHKVTPVSKYLAIVLFMIMPFIGGWIGYNYAPDKIVEIEKKVFIESVVNNLSNQNIQYKETFLSGKIPTDWSEVAMSASSYYDGKSRVYSFSPNVISFEDISWDQVDFYFLEKEAIDEVLNNAEEAEGKISSQIIGEKSVTVIQYPLDDGHVTKGGTGGTSYIVEIPEYDWQGSDIKNVLIVKQAFGDEVFEAGVQHYLETVDFSSIFKQY